MVPSMAVLLFVCSDPRPMEESYRRTTSHSHKRASQNARATRARLQLRGTKVFEVVSMFYCPSPSIFYLLSSFFLLAASSAVFDRAAEPVIIAVVRINVVDDRPELRHVDRRVSLHHAAPVPLSRSRFLLSEEDPDVLRAGAEKRVGEGERW